MSDDNHRNVSESIFTYGATELREAADAARQRLAAVAVKPGKETKGFDPYNSGGFDRTRGWTRIRKR